eukprot:4489624-Amphidinium_carterae.1
MVIVLVLLQESRIKVRMYIEKTKDYKAEQVIDRQMLSYQHPAADQAIANVECLISYSSVLMRPLVFWSSLEWGRVLNEAVRCCAGVRPQTDMGT